jgi:hypothetical protein
MLEVMFKILCLFGVEDIHFSGFAYTEARACFFRLYWILEFGPDRANFY